MTKEQGTRTIKDYGGQGPDQVHAYRGFVETLIRSQLVMEGCEGDTESKMFQTAKGIALQTIIDAQKMGFNPNILVTIADHQLKKMQKDDRT